MVSVSGTAAAISQALYLNMNNYTRPDGTQFYAPDREPSLDFDPTVDHISRLDNLFVSKPLNGSGYADGGVRPEGPNAYLGKDLRNAYAACHLSLTGAGQAIGLVENGFSVADLNAYSQVDLGTDFNSNQVTTVFADQNYQKCTFPAVYCKDNSLCGPAPVCLAHGWAGCCPGEPLDKMTTCNVTCDSDVTGCSTTGSICSDVTDKETPMDMALVLGMAPGATIVVFQGAHDSTILQAMANYTDIRINQFSTSFWLPLDENATKALKQMAGQGQTFFSSSGDNGAEDSPGDLRKSDLVTTVGGTSLLMKDNGVSYISESTWAEEPPGNSSGGFYTSGNAYFGVPATSKPAYQQFIDMQANGRGGSNLYRNVPDVAAAATNIEFFVGTNPNYNVSDPINNLGGTSASSPIGQASWRW